jgi:hypothetical protein
MELLQFVVFTSDQRACKVLLRIRRLMRRVLTLNAVRIPELVEEYDIAPRVTLMSGDPCRRFFL